jgi:branched-subunit amino acid ABC-type transport system permease component
MISLLWQATFFGLVSASILALAAVGFTLQFGVTNVLNFAFPALMTLSAFLAYTLNQLVHNFWIAALLAILLSGLLSNLLHRLLIQPFLRKGSSFFVLLMVTFSLSIIIQNLILALWGASFFSLSTSGNESIHFLGLTASNSELVIIAISVVVMGGIHLLLIMTDLGKAMRAISDDVALAQLSAIHTSAVMDIAWFISGCVGGIAGLVLALNTASFTSATGSLYFPSILAAALLGGIGRPYGAMIGAIVLGLASEWTASLFGSTYSFAAALAILILVLLFRPQGIISSVRNMKGATA